MSWGNARGVIDRGGGECEEGVHMSIGSEGGESMYVCGHLLYRPCSPRASSRALGGGSDVVLCTISMIVLLMCARSRKNEKGEGRFFDENVSCFGNRPVDLKRLIFKNKMQVMFDFLLNKSLFFRSGKRRKKHGARRVNSCSKQARNAHCKPRTHTNRGRRSLP